MKKKTKLRIALNIERIPWIKASMERRFNMKPVTMKNGKEYDRKKDKQKLKEEHKNEAF